jgi:hypothetical protein
MEYALITNPPPVIVGGPAEYIVAASSNVIVPGAEIVAWLKLFMAKTAPMVPLVPTVPAVYFIVPVPVLM